MTVTTVKTYLCTVHMIVRTIALLLLFLMLTKTRNNWFPPCLRPVSCSRDTATERNASRFSIRMSSRFFIS